jgi:hypothetical protein
MSLEKLKEGLKVIGLKDTKYEGLKGRITKLLKSNNDANLDIEVNFEESPYAPIEYTHPHLKDTNISQIICGIQELGFMFKENSPFYMTIEGKAVCPSCYIPMDIVTEIQHEEITWIFKNGEYIKEDSAKDSEGKRCSKCDARLDDFNDEIFPY